MNKDNKVKSEQKKDEVEKSKTIKKLSREFKNSLDDIADHDDFKEVKTSINVVNKKKTKINCESGLGSVTRSKSSTLHADWSNS